MPRLKILPVGYYTKRRLFATLNFIIEIYLIKYYEKEILEFLKGQIEIILILSSTHVVDLTFFLGEVLKQIHCFVKEDFELEWHKNGDIYVAEEITYSGNRISCG